MGNDLTELGRRLAEQRRKADLTEAELAARASRHLESSAERAGRVMDQSRVSRLEHGKAPPPHPHEAAALVQALAEAQAEWTLDDGMYLVAPLGEPFVRAVPAWVSQRPGWLLSEPPTLPPGYVVRRAHLNWLIANTLPPSPPGTAHDKSVALVGMAGAGKSTLLMALLRAPSVWQAFRGGAFWLTLGYRPDIAGCIAKIARALSLESSIELPPPGAPLTHEIVERYRAALRGKGVLLILDDVVDPADAEALALCGHGNQTVLSTRRLAVIERLARSKTPGSPAILHRAVGMLEEGESLDLLASLCGPLTAEQEQQARRLAGLLEHHPLLLNVTAPLVQKLGFERVIERLLTSPSKRHALDEERAAWPLLDVVREQMGQPLAARLLALGSVPLLREFDRRLLQALWRVRDPDADLTQLVDLNLLQPTREQDGSQNYRLHFLVWDYCRAHRNRAVRLQTAGWAFRYRLRRSRPWWQPVPRPKGEAQWPWYQDRVPGLEQKGRYWMLDLLKQLWASDGLRLAIDADTWAETLRLQRAFQGIALAEGVTWVTACALLATPNIPSAARLIALPTLAVTVLLYPALWWTGRSLRRVLWTWLVQGRAPAGAVGGT